MNQPLSENHGKLLGIYDELTSFLTSLNLYRSKGLSETHDMAMFLQLYNGHPWSRRTGLCLKVNNSAIMQSLRYLFLPFLLYLVTGDANFIMERTALTVGGFTQPSVARTLIEQQGSAEKGFCQRFLWIFPKPVFSTFKTLEPISNDFTEDIG